MSIGALFEKEGRHPKEDEINLEPREHEEQEGPG